MTQGPRADFSCATCSKKSDRPFIIENLPVRCLRCPICGHKRGFVRLFNAVNIGNTNARQTDKLLDAALTPLLDKNSATKQSAARFEHAATDSLEKTYEQSTPKERATMDRSIRPHIMPASAALNSISPQARIDSREVIYPALANRKVVPEWHR